MKSVLISIRPEWVEKILSGEKTVEVRKTAPKIATPFKCYIYCTKGNLSYKTPGGMICHNNGGMDVVGEFVCDRITPLFNICTDDWSRLMGDTHEWHKQLIRQACLTEADLKAYAKGKNCFAWHISDLKIYDKPLNVRQFVVDGDCDCLNCRKCFWRNPGNGYNVEDDCNLVYEYLGTGKTLKPLFRPPQSWCYVEEGESDVSQEA